MLIDEIAAVLPCDFHTRVAGAVCHGHGLSWCRAIASVNVENRHCWNGRRGCHIVSLSVLGLRDSPSGLRDLDCGCLSWRRDGPFDERCGSFAEGRFCNCLSSSWGRRILGRDLLNCRCLSSPRQETRVSLYDGLRRGVRCDGFALQGAREINCGALADSGKCNGRLHARVGDGGS
jgi:hypothetical protein